MNGVHIHENRIAKAGMLSVAIRVLAKAVQARLLLHVNNPPASETKAPSIFSET